MMRLKAFGQKTVVVGLALLLLASIVYSQSRKPSPTYPPTTTSQKFNPLRVQFSISTRCYVPAHGRLQGRPVPARVIEAQSRARGNRTALLNEVIRQSPRYFPPKARVLAVSQEGEQQHGQYLSFFRINLNRDFANSTFWRGRNRRDTRLAFHVLARNVAFIDEGKGVPLPVQFVLENQSVQHIGTFATQHMLAPGQIIQVQP